LQIGCSVFDDSKLRMNSFYYDLVDKYIDRSNFQYIEMDCDSAYMALTGNLEYLIKPELRNKFEFDKVNCFPRLDNLSYNKRTPGLFKVEFEGIGAIALCCKAYYVWGNDKFKYSCKGAQKHRVAFIKEQYFNCLKFLKFIICENVGFRRHGSVIKTYEQSKIGLSPIYTKGVVMNNGINITALKI